MPDQDMDEKRLKDLLKAAVIELLEERRELLRDILEEAMEDIGLARAIDEGAATKTVEASEVYEILKGRP